MSSRVIIGLVVLVVGLVLLGFGLNSSHAPVDRISQTFTGRFTQETMTYLIAGAVAVVAGALLAVSGRRA